MKSPVYKSRQMLFDFQCYEDINSMSKKEDGRHCSTCDKILIDFRNWENQEIRNYLTSNKSEHVCGFFNPHQIINDSIIKPKTVSHYSIFYPAQIAFLAMAALISGCTNTSNSNTHEKESEEKKTEDRNVSGLIDTNENKATSEDKIMHQCVKGKLNPVVDMLGEISEEFDPGSYVTAGIPVPDYEEPEIDINYPTNNSKRDINDFVDESAKFPGGDQAMYDFISKNLIYPKQAKENDIEGKVYIQITIEANGEISDSKVLKGVDELLNNAALEVTTKMPKWEPGKIKNQPVASRFVIPIHFKIK